MFTIAAAAAFATTCPRADWHGTQPQAAVSHYLVTRCLLIFLLLLCSAAAVESAPAPQPVRFVHLTDPCLDRTALTRSRQRLAQAVTAINALKPAFILVTGNLTAHGDATEFAAWQTAAAAFTAPVYTVPGERDHDANGGLQQYDEVGRRDYTVEHGDIRVIGIDNTVWDAQRKRPSRRGRFNRLAWLEAELRSPSDATHTIVFGAVPASDALAGNHSLADMPEWPEARGAKLGFYRLLEKYEVTACLAGHSRQLYGVEFKTLHAAAPVLYRGPGGFLLWECVGNELRGSLRRLNGAVADTVPPHVRGRLQTPTTRSRPGGTAWQGMASSGKTLIAAHQSGAESRFYHDLLPLGVLSCDRVERSARAPWQVNLQADTLTVSPSLPVGTLTTTSRARADGVDLSWEFTGLQAPAGDSRQVTLTLSVPWFLTRGARGRMHRVDNDSWQSLMLHRYQPHAFTGFDQVELTSAFGHRLVLDWRGTSTQGVKARPWQFVERHGDLGGAFIQTWEFQDNGRYTLALKLSYRPPPATVAPSD
jgi:hypothetical protein